MTQGINNRGSISRLIDRNNAAMKEKQSIHSYTCRVTKYVVVAIPTKGRIIAGGFNFTDKIRADVPFPPLPIFAPDSSGRVISIIGLRAGAILEGNS
jgi:hypothetical protein